MPSSELSGGKKPTVLAIFGISGDLSRRYLLPALAEIKKVGQLPDTFKVLGISRRDIGAKDIFDSGTHSLAKDTHFLQMDMDERADYKHLKEELGKLAGGAQAQIIFYLVVPPDAVPNIIGHLGAAGLNGPNVKLLLEKPFGHDLKSAKALIAQIDKCFKEEQVYRIDHYLAKGVAQNISTFLDSNALFRDVWSKNFIEYIEIVAAEKIGLEGRIHFYEQTGALRDFVQSHLLQLAALTLMDPCDELLDFSDLPARRLKALRVLRPAEDLHKTVVRAQYQGYGKEAGNPSSKTETFVALKLASKDPRWKDVPIYLATGKRLDQKLTQIRINFKESNSSQANTLVLRIQPHDGIDLGLWVKKPGYDKELDKKTLSFSFAQNFDRLPDAYEQVLVDAIRSDHSLFASSQEVLASWEVLQPIIDFWQAGDGSLRSYKPGSSVEQVLARD